MVSLVLKVQQPLLQAQAVPVVKAEKGLMLWVPRPVCLVLRAVLAVTAVTAAPTAVQAQPAQASAASVVPVDKAVMA